MMKHLYIFSISIFIASLSYSQNYKYTNIVIEGGAIRGVAYTGALQYIDSLGLLANIKRVGGTSAGSIQALTLSIGYKPSEIQQIISDLKFHKFSDGRLLLGGGIFRLIKKFGWNKGKEYYQFLEKLIEQKKLDPNITFEALHELVCKDSITYKDLYVVGTNLSKQRYEVFSYETYPKMKIKDAVRISGSMPLFLKAVFMDAEGTTYKRYYKYLDLDVMVDGGLVANYPIFIFDSTKYIYSNLTPGSNQYTINEQTIGLRADNAEQIEYDKNGIRNLAPYKIIVFKDYLAALFYMLLENINRNSLTENDWKRTISINTLGIRASTKKLSKEERANLIKSGKIAADNFFKMQLPPLAE